MEEMIFFKEFNVVKILERGAFKVWKEVEVGKEVSLEGDDKEKPKTILVKFGDSFLGELPEKESEIIRIFFKQNWKNAFKAWVCKKDKEALYDQRISIAVYITYNKEKADENNKNITE